MISIRKNTEKEKFSVVIVLGTAREGRQTEKVAGFIVSELSKNSVAESRLIDVRDFLFGRTIDSEEKHEGAEKWRKIAGEADAFILVFPEYNHSFPGELKILLDSAYDEYKGKPVLLAGVSAGGFGGTRAVEAMRGAVAELGLIALGKALYFPKVGGFLGSDGKAGDPTSAQKVREMTEILIAFAGSLRISPSVKIKS